MLYPQKPTKNWCSYLKVKAKTFCSKVLISKKYFFNINLLSKISHFFKKMKFSNFKALYIKFDASLKLENHVKRCVYVSIFKLFFFFNYDAKISFYIKKNIFFSFLLNFSKITEDQTWKCTQKKVWNFQQTIFRTTLKLT